MIPNPYPGIFIVIDGIDGCGKSSQVTMLADWLRGMHSIPTRDLNPDRVILETKEPDKKGPFGKMIYADLDKKDGLHVADPFRFQMWYACDSKIHLREKIIPRLKLGGIVISDRFRSSMVYGVQSPKTIVDLMRMNQMILGEDFIWPDVIFILDISPEVAIERLKEKGRALDGHEEMGKLARTRQQYWNFVREYPNCIVIKHEGDTSREGIAQIIREHVQKLLASKPHSGV